MSAESTALHEVRGWRDIASASRDTDTFSSWEEGIFPDRDQVIPLEVTRNLLLYMDPPQHTKYRKILQTAFIPHSVAKLEDRVREIVTEALDDATADGRCDFVADVAVPIPLRTLMLLMGLPRSDEEFLTEWVAGIEAATVAPEPASATEQFVELAGYLSQQIAAQKEAGEESLVTTLTEAEVDGERLTDEEILVFFGLLIFAGNDTTRNTMAGGMLALLEHPDQLNLLRSEPDRVEGAVEEILRWTSVVNWFCRTATTDTELGGCPISSGTKILMHYPSGSRDPGVNENPEAFDITRAEPKHMAFGGGGRHFCLGAGLARLELRVAFEEILRRLEDVRLAGEPEHLPSEWANALTSLPIEFKPATKESSPT